MTSERRPKETINGRLKVPGGKESKGTRKGTRRRARRDAKKGSKRDREKGREEGLEKGVLVGKIHLVEQLLDEVPTTGESLVNRSTEELTALLADLQQRLRSRGH